MTNNNYEVATFAGGCFWCMVQPFDTQPGIEKVISGYIGGVTENPTYEEVCAGVTGHTEAVQITYDPAIYPYKKLVELYWQQIDPTDAGGQFGSRGSSYRTEIIYHNAQQKEIAEQSKEELINSGRFDKPIVTEIVEAKTFYPAEDYHQGYYRKNPEKYSNFKEQSGRAPFIRENWKVKV
ncbi:peptide-methionine (S)-S-oxide reductase MsrA [Sporosarcina sp. CAU 1771]